MAEGDRGPGLGVNAGAGVAGAGVAGAPRAMEGGAGGGGWGPGARAVPARVAFRGGAGGGRRSLLLGLAPGAPAGPAEAFVSVPQTGLFRVSAPEEAGAAAGSAPVPHLRLVLEPGRTEQVLVDFEPGSKAKEALAQGRPVRDELMVWAAGRPLQVPLLVMPPGAETAGEQDYFPDQEVVARGLDIFLKSMRRHFPFHAGGQLPLEAEFPPPGGSGRGNEPKGEGGAERGGRARGEAPGSPVTGSRGGGGRWAPACRRGRRGQAGRSFHQIVLVGCRRLLVAAPKPGTVSRRGACQEAPRSSRSPGVSWTGTDG